MSLAEVLIGVILLVAGIAILAKTFKKDIKGKAIEKQSLADFRKSEAKSKKSENSSSTKTDKIKGWGIASLVVAILSILLPFFGIILAILGVIFYRIQKKHGPTGIATAGLVISIIGIVFNLIILASLIITLAFY